MSSLRDFGKLKKVGTTVTEKCSYPSENAFGATNIQLSDNRRFGITKVQPTT